MTKKKADFSVNLHDPLYYNNREISWLNFNERVLDEAFDQRNPLLERFKFISIFSSNLDEFFMVRVAGLKDQVKAGFTKPDNKSALTPQQQLQKISEENHRLVNAQDQLLKKTLIPLLAAEGILFLPVDDLTTEQLNYISNHFNNYVLPVLTPLAIDAYRPFPMLLNKSLNLAISLKSNSKGKEEKLAIVQVPAVLNRVLPIPSPGDKSCFIMLEDVISHFIGRLFHGNTVQSVSPFRITRNADLTIHEEGARDLLREIEKELQKRKWGAAVRLEIKTGNMDQKVLAFLKDVLELEQSDLYELSSPIDLTFFSAFYEYASQYYEGLTNDPFIPQRPNDLSDEDDLFTAVEKRDIFLHHPYESFQPIIDLISRAAVDENVLAIKQTLYRVSGDSQIIASLAKAAKHGKQVTVLVEIKARFDEEKNIQWAKKLEKAGVHVIYGISGLKTHSKITLIIRHNKGEIQRFVHLATGNYNDTTAKVYTDMSILTTNSSFGMDATNFFNYLSGYADKPKWKKLITSPFDIRDAFIKLINTEISYHLEHKDGYIIAKMNSLTDKTIILKLYEASRAGVTIELVIRGICCLRPGIPKVSENIRVISIIDRFLEHSRIFYFHHHGDEKIYLSSADWMTRNMEKRIELLFPVHEKLIKKRIKAILDIYLTDNVKARIQNKDGGYSYVEKKQGAPTIQSQRIFYQMAATYFEDN